MMQQRQAHKQARNVIQDKLAQVKERITKSGAGEDEDVLPKFLPFERKYVSLERCGGTMLPKKPLGPPYSPHALTQCEMP